MVSVPWTLHYQTYILHILCFNCFVELRQVEDSAFDGGNESLMYSMTCLSMLISSDAFYLPACRDHFCPFILGEWDKWVSLVYICYAVYTVKCVLIFMLIFKKHILSPIFFLLFEPVVTHLVALVTDVLHLIGNFL